MWNREIKDKLYISLDSMLDTELGLVLQHTTSKKKIKRYLAKFKKTDVRHPSVHLGIFEKEQFEDFWAERSKEALLRAGMTGIFSKLLEIINEHADVINRDPYTAVLKLTIDTYPYQLNKSELDMIAAGVTNYIGFDTVIDYVYIGELELTPALLQDYAWAIIKDSENWLKYHMTAAKKYPRLLETRVLFPATTTGESLKDLMDDPDLNQEQLAAEDPHTYVARLISQYIDTTMIDPNLFKAT